MDNLNVEINNQKLRGKIKSFLTLPKIVFAVLGVIVLIELIFAFKTLTVLTPPLPSPVVKTDIQPTPQKSVAKISLNTAQTVFRIKEVVPVSVMIDTGGRGVNGVDLIVQYDTKRLEATSGGLIKGKIFDEYPLLSVDSSKGVISISGISNIRSNFTGKGQFALLNFKAKFSGKTSLIINFRKGSTTASNLVEASTAKNILDEVNNLDLEVQ